MLNPLQDAFPEIILPANRLRDTARTMSGCQIKKQNTMEEVNITAYDDRRHHDAFRRLNEQWIRDIFGVVEETDHYELDHPVEHIVNQGGYIFMAEYKGQPVGSLAMMKSKNPKYDFELVKFAVDPTVRGKRIGSRLLERVIDEARRLGAKHLFLESNHNNAAAVHLYEKFGFRHIPVGHTEYARCDIQMEMDL